MAAATRMSNKGITPMGKWRTMQRGFPFAEWRPILAAFLMVLMAFLWGSDEHVPGGGMDYYPGAVFQVLENGTI